LIDYAEVTLLASSAFFAAVSVGLLYRYRQVSRSIGESTDMGRDLWSALEQRLRKQDERILDVMARLEVVQARVMNLPAVATAPPAPAPMTVEPTVAVVKPAVVPEIKPGDATEIGDLDVTEPVVPQPVSLPASQESHPMVSPSAVLELDETQLSAIRLLSQKEMNTREITDALNKSREHTARIMKALFEWGLVTRDDKRKPFVYKLTDAGRARLS